MVDALFAFDARLSDLVAKANEPMLAQIRLAWWRDELGKPAALRAKGDPVLDALSSTWDDEGAALSGLVDGWEYLTSTTPLASDDIAAFAAARGKCAGALACMVGAPDARDEADRAAQVWGLADFAARVGNATEREMALTLARAIDRRSVRLPRALRPLAILHGLASRAVRIGGGPLVRGRTDVLVALRLGMLGR